MFGFAPAGRLRLLLALARQVAILLVGADLARLSADGARENVAGLVRDQRDEEQREVGFLLVDRPLGRIAAARAIHQADGPQQAELGLAEAEDDHFAGLLGRHG